MVNISNVLKSPSEKIEVYEATVCLSVLTVTITAVTVVPANINHGLVKLGAVKYKENISLL